MKTKDPLQKEMAEERKEEKIRQAELEKQQAYEQNAIRKGEAHHAGVGQQASLGGHQTGLGEPTSGVAVLHRTDPPSGGAETNLSKH